MLNDTPNNAASEKMTPGKAPNSNVAFAETENGLYLRVLKQTKHGYPDGNCFATCIAMITGIELDEIPNFASYTEINGNWWKDICDWLAPRAWGGIMITEDAMRNNVSDCYGFRQVGMPFIITGKSPGGDYNHCVVQWDESKGTRELDPALSGKGLLEPIIDIIILVPLFAYRKAQAAISASLANKADGEKTAGAIESLLYAVEELVPYLDNLTDYSSTMLEWKPNRLLKEIPEKLALARASLANDPTRKELEEKIGCYKAREMMLKRGVVRLWESIQSGMHDSRSLVGDVTLNMKEILFGDEWPKDPSIASRKALEDALKESAEAFELIEHMARVGGPSDYAPKIAALAKEGSEGTRTALAASTGGAS